MAVVEQNVMENTSNEDLAVETATVIRKLEEGIQQAKTVSENTVAINDLIDNRDRIGEVNYQRLLDIALN